MSVIQSHWHFFVVFLLMAIGLHAVAAYGNLIKRTIGLNVMQTSVFGLYVSAAKIKDGTVPILTGDPTAVYANPLPHVLILTAIVVGVATTAIAYALIIGIHERCGTIEDDEIASSYDEGPSAAGASYADRTA